MNNNSNPPAVYSFNPKWLNEFKWLNKKKAEIKIAYCNVCSKKLTARRFHLSRHEQNDVHIRLSQAVKKAPTIQNALVKSANVEAAEEKIVMFAVEHNVALRSMDHLVSLIKCISLIPQKELQTISCARTKATAIVKNRFGPL